MFVLRKEKWGSRPSEWHEALCQVIEVIKVEEEWKREGLRIDAVINDRGRGSRCNEVCLDTCVSCLFDLFQPLICFIRRSVTSSNLLIASERQNDRNLN